MFAKGLSTIVIFFNLASCYISLSLSVLAYLPLPNADGTLLQLVAFDNSAVAINANYSTDKGKISDDSKAVNDKDNYSANSDTNAIAKGQDCISYNKKERSIVVSCGHVRLSDLYNILHNPSVLDKQDKQQKQGIWLLNANLTIGKDATLVIDPTDTSWLKIISDGKSLSYGIHIYGSLKIDSVKVTSWSPSTNSYVLSNGSRETYGKIVHLGIPRPYIRVESHGLGTLNITNSEIAHLGYEGGWGSGTSGIHYHNAGDNSIIKNNNIHHLYFGFYSVSLGGMVIENNLVHDNGHYGIDPHTATHDMIIRNNTVYNNNGTGIICSLDCYNIAIENNNVHNNTGAGIVFSRNMSHSIARNNYIHDQAIAILISRSNNNEVYNNTLVNTDPGISIVNASLNKIHNNYIKNASSAFTINGTSQHNTIYANTIITNPSSALREKVIAYENTTNTTNTGLSNNTFRDNKIIKLKTLR